MKHGSLFSGIGGFDLAAQWMGWENVFHCEIAEFPRKILHHYWPNAISYENIIETDFTKHRGGIDVISGGFPCQPYSLAGKRLGKEDARHLWPEMLRVIREVQPRWVVGENVYGLVNWNGGLVFDEVQSDLEAEGYEVQAFVLPACAVNAPHRRDRVWFVAHSCGNGCERNKEYKERQQYFTRGPTFGEFNAYVSFTPAPNPDRHERREGRLREAESEEAKRHISARDARGNAIPGWDNFPTQSPVCGRNDGLSFRLDGITFPKWRNESIKGYGNAVVPQVVYQIFHAIQIYESCNYGHTS